MTTFCALTPQALTSAPTDSLRRAEWKAKQAALRKKLQADADAQTGMSHADSAYLFPADGSFCELCTPAEDIELLVSPSTYQSAYIARAAKADSVALRQTTAITTTQPAPLEPTPRGHAPLRPYAGPIVLSFLVVIVALAVVKVVSRTFLADLFGFFTSSVGWKRLEASQFVQKNLSFTLVNAVYVLMLAILTIEAALIFAPSVVSSIGVYKAVGIVAAALVVYYFGRVVADSVIGYAFRVERRLGEVAVYRQAACGIMGLFLAPCALLMPFVSAEGCEFLIGTAAVVIIGMTMLCLGKVMRINLTSLPTILYFILYLCIVVAAPLICLARLVMLGSAGEF